MSCSCCEARRKASLAQANESLTGLCQFVAMQAPTVIARMALRKSCGIIAKLA
jgi:hypothetical protein